MSLAGVVAGGGISWGPITLASIIPSTPISDNIWFADGYGTWYGTGNGTTQPDSTITWDDANQWLQLAIPGAAGTGLAEFRFRGDFSRAGAADTFYLNQFLPGVLTLTGGVAQTAAALFAFSATAVANTPTVTGLYGAYFEHPTASGTFTRAASVVAETRNSRGDNLPDTAFHGLSTATYSSGQRWHYMLAMGNAAASHGALSTTNFTGNVATLGIHLPGHSYNGIDAPGLVLQSAGIMAFTTMGMAANQDLAWGTNTSGNPALGAVNTFVSGIDWSTPQTNDGLVWGLATANASLLFVGYANRNNDYAAAAATNPTLYVYSATAAATATDEWISFTHNVTDGVIAVGSGNVLIGGTAAFAVAATARIYLDGGGNTSIREAAADTIMFETGGADRMFLNTSTLRIAAMLSLDAGAVGAPTIAWDGDPNTGIYHVAADRDAWSVGGTKILELWNDTGTLKLGFFDLTTPVIKQTITGASAGASGVANSVADALIAYGLAIDGRT